MTITSNAHAHGYRQAVKWRLYLRPRELVVTDPETTLPYLCMYRGQRQEKHTEHEFKSYLKMIPPYLHIA
jgi:hypothetical protein